MTTPASVVELHRRTDQAITARLGSAKPLTAKWLGEAARVTDGAALIRLRHHVAAGRLVCRWGPGMPAPYFDTYTPPEGP